MIPLFVDTSAWWAYFLSRDQWHEPAVRLMAQFDAEGRPLVSTPDVFGELVTGLSARANHTIAVEAGQALMENPLFQMAAVERSTWREAWRLFQREARPRVSLTDCTSIALMRERRIREIFTFDDDFRRLGFQVVPDRP